MPRKTSAQLLLPAPPEKAPSEWILESDDIKRALAEILEIETQAVLEAEASPLIAPSVAPARRSLNK